MNSWPQQTLISNAIGHLADNNDYTYSDDDAIDILHQAFCDVLHADCFALHSGQLISYWSVLD